MSALRVVLLAEGAGEVLPNRLRGPNSSISPDDFGPAHVLFARAIANVSRVPRAAVQFLEPLRTGRGVVAKGSALHGRQLRQLLNYQPVDRPDLLIVLVDGDGDEKTRRLDLRETVRDLPGNHLIAVAVQEFEAWLLSDAVAVAEVLQLRSDAVPSNPWELAPNEAKERLASLMSATTDPRKARLSICERLTLSALERSPAFSDCLAELRALLR